MYIIIVDTRADWGHLTIINEADQSYPKLFPDFHSAEEWFLNSRLNVFPVRFLDLDRDYDYEEDK